MIRRVVIVVLIFAAMGTGVLDYLGRIKPLIYFCESIETPTWWKLYTAQAESGKLRIAFESQGEHIFIAADDLPYDDGRGRGGPRPILRITLRRRLEHMGFYVRYSALWSYGGGTDESGEYWNVKAMSYNIGFGVPSWFLIVVFLSYPAIAAIRSPARRRRYRWKHGLCLACGYNLTGNISGLCPECGTEVESP